MWNLRAKVHADAGGGGCVVGAATQRVNVRRLPWQRRAQAVFLGNRAHAAEMLSLFSADAPEEWELAWPGTSRVRQSPASVADLTLAVRLPVIEFPGQQIGPFEHSAEYFRSSR